MAAGATAMSKITVHTFLALILAGFCVVSATWVLISGRGQPGDMGVRGNPDDYRGAFVWAGIAGAILVLAAYLFYRRMTVGKRGGR
jgi:hypothetical protein